ncbi:tRNA lysidine(34) synthetase TilS [Salipaludibacillus agaradhaerens]|uniref:tRNA(Ile)-lysidine synthase n=1 Tax=Salipaludibacillus agaradhaerens TaxID=76935 RepID=A0A9Q4B4X6_SALAG|nr:tRNA lysidine(34) synthetase TilS [Salipaludibacillus agaradhaerens]MCR6098392.1 tRNA lysidine(34) synthetase TilS [Salipaludibacillus agaradhaerens]MCR6115978.1 tRNA lysidine(34) synthetase TilS [Salipaludibacillus agaradhaerens]
MKQAINSFITKHGLIEEGDHLLVAVSGGPDSMALIHYLMELSNIKKIQLSVSHVEHGLRGEESKKDAALVASFCQKYSLPFYLYEADVKKKKLQQAMSTQEAARLCRYEWFEHLMHKLGTTKLVTAHHGDDQIETMLMRQLRGSLSGRKGIPVKRVFAEGYIIRPLLAVEKTKLLEYCATYNIPYRKDQSNDEDKYLRNRIRHHVLPFIKEENPKAHHVFQWQSEVLADEEEWLHHETIRVVDKVMVFKGSHKIVVSLEAFDEVAKALQRRAIHLILNYLLISHQLQFDRSHIEAILDLIRQEHPSGEVHLPKNITVEKSYESLIFSIKTPFLKEESGDQNKELVLPLPGELAWATGTISADTLDGKMPLKNDPYDIFIDLNKVSLPFIIRARRAGDRMSFFGGKGTKKLKDVFIEAKVAKGDRDLWPIVTDSHGTILWVPSLKRSNEGVVDDKSENIVQLTYRANT